VIDRTTALPGAALVIVLSSP